MITTTAIGSSTPGPASARVASMPSSPGIRMSKRHTSGRRLRASAHRLGAVGRLADHLDVGLRVEDHAEPGAHELLVVGDEHADGHVVHPARGSTAVTAHPPPGAGPASQVPPSRVARSIIPVMP